MDTKKLRQKILNLAIHGKLVPQDPNDEPASVLLERIKAEKERLIKEGKIKRSKKPVKTSDTPHYENVPFEVPSSWVWTTVNDISKSILYGVSESAKSEGKYKLLRITDIQNNQVDWGTVPFTDFDEDKVSSYILHDGDIVFARTGATVGKSYLIDGLRQKAIYASYLIRVQTFDLILPEYVKLFFESGYYWGQIELGSVGIGQPNVNGTILGNLNIPLPPLVEQQRIVAEIKKWFALIDQIEQGKTDLQTTIKQTKSKILDLAIHGKLVPQDPNDEPAIELLKRINPGFTPCDNGHSEKLPQNWTWVKGKNIFAPMKSTKPKNEEFQYIDIDSIDNRRQIISEIKTIKTENAPSRASRYTQKNDVIFSMVRPYLRNIAKVANDNCIASTGFYVCSPIPQLLNSDYCYYLMISDNVVNGLNQFMKGDNSPSINKGHIDEWLFPLPPLAEQQRIVQKIEELFSALDNIQTALEV
ncbi:restriction endonuclease subunit S [Bacteroides caccae]|uniref:restriction endonuclease subunit S n=1 Tax=Bacteroides caccae TaxID=47678 RepID=UPI00356297A3